CWIVRDETAITHLDFLAAGGGHKFLLKEGIGRTGPDDGVTNGTAEAGLEGRPTQEGLSAVGLEDDWPLFLPTGSDNAQIGLERVELQLPKHFCGEFF